jgi:hypothetical protein
MAMPDLDPTDHTVTLNLGMVAATTVDASSYSATFDNYLVQTVVPEPRSVVLLSIAGVLAAIWGRRRAKGSPGRAESRGGTAPRAGDRA